MIRLTMRTGEFLFIRPEEILGYFIDNRGLGTIVITRSPISIIVKELPEQIREHINEFLQKS